MDRFGVFVDAGYLYAASGKLLYGTTDRSKFSLSFDSMSAALKELGENDSGSVHLRTYCYDGARDAIPTAQHLVVANLPGVKLRLGRLTPHGQKGVDSRIVRDLIILATQRAISTAYLIGGDEDLREGVSEAQERGVRVVLVGVEPLDEQNLSPTLVMEADDVLVLDRAFAEPHFRVRAPAWRWRSSPRIRLIQRRWDAHLLWLGAKMRLMTISARRQIPSRCQSPPRSIDRSWPTACASWEAEDLQMIRSESSGKGFVWLFVTWPRGG